MSTTPKKKKEEIWRCVTRTHIVQVCFLLFSLRSWHYSYLQVRFLQVLRSWLWIVFWLIDFFFSHNSCEQCKNQTAHQNAQFKSGNFRLLYICCVQFWECSLTLFTVNKMLFTGCVCQPVVFPVSQRLCFLGIYFTSNVSSCYLSAASVK